MSPSKRRARRSRGRTRGEEHQGTAPPAPLPEWDWRTFPVFFAFALGGFLALVAAVALGTFPLGLTIVFAVFAGMVGFGISRLATRALMKRGIIKPRPGR